MPDKDLYFEVGAGLKDIIGKDLISDDFIAVFELVKNSFDAHAEEVKIIFEKGKIVIVDNGKGMSYSDIQKKWLRVAYSAKKEGEEDLELKSPEFKDYRDKIHPTNYFAGAKGIGRFSCDRLGSKLLLTTKKIGTKGKYEQIQTDWGKFEINPHEKFESIKIKYKNPPQIPRYNYFNNGTILEISSLRSEWNKEKIIELKHSLEKLINPFDIVDTYRKSYIKTNKRKFQIIIESSLYNNSTEGKKDIRNRVNGPVQNFVFETLKLKTTQIFTEIPAHGLTIVTELVDRGKTIYRIEEPNPYKGLLANIRFHLFYLNHSAKINFKKTMAITSVEFGSVFLYKNGFRVYPFGEEGQDSFGIDRRKQQGYARYLGTRDIIGRIEIYGNDKDFKETTSRDGGLIRTKSYEALEKCFFDLCLKRLENYVVDIQWKLKDTSDNLSIIQNNISASTSIASIISRLTDNKEVKLKEYAKNLVQVINDKLSELKPDVNVFENLEKIANKTNDVKFNKEIKNARKEYLRLIKEREEAENRARKEEEDKNRAEFERKMAQEAYELERKKNLFFNATGKDNNKATLGLIHHIKLTSKALSSRIKILARDIKNEKFDPIKSLEILHELKIYSEKILKLSEIVTYSDLNFKYAKHNGDLVKFICEYFAELSPGLPDVKIIINSNGNSFLTEFSILEMSIVFDNLLSNAIKASERDKKIQIDIKKRTNGGLRILFSDNGVGINDDIKRRIFEIGFTTTRGSGIGLYTVKDLIHQAGGEILFLGNNKVLKGATFEIKI